MKKFLACVSIAIIFTLWSLGTIEIAKNVKRELGKHFAPLAVDIATKVINRGGSK